MPVNITKVCTRQLSTEHSLTRSRSPDAERAWRGALMKRGSPALLKGLVFDADGRRMQPTHAVKNGVRYRYYTSARRLRAAREEPGGIRVPAGDLERIVVNAIVARLKDAKEIHRWLEPRVPASELPRTLESVSRLADTIAVNGSVSTMLIRSIIGKIVVSRSSLRINLVESGLRASLGIKDSRRVP